MNPNNYTSLALSKTLAEAGFEGESCAGWYLVDGEDWYCVSDDNAYETCEFTDSFPAYDIANDLLIRYAKEVWGVGRSYKCWNDEGEEMEAHIADPMYVYHPFKVFLLLQQNMKQEAEDYIMEHSVLFKK